MRIKKLFAIFMSIMLIGGVLAGCGVKQEAGKETAKKLSTEWTKEKITLHYAGWEPEANTKLMLDGFMKKYPNVTVVWDKQITWPWNDSLTAAASAGKLPDVFWLDTVETPLNSNWLLDVSKYWNNDPEADLVWKQVKKTHVYDGKRFAMVGWVIPWGVMVNKTLFEKNNVPLPSYNWTYDEMFDTAKKMSKPDEYYYGISGAGYNLRLEEYLPMQDNKKMGYGTFDGKDFHYDDPAWSKAYNKKLELQKLKIEDAMTNEDRKKVFGNPDAWAFQEGHVAMASEGGWVMNGLAKEMKSKGVGELDFYPYPGGKAGQRMPVVTDNIGVASTTKHPEAAYALAKWMSWGRDGMNYRMDQIYTKDNSDLCLYPVANYPDVLEKEKKLVPFPGQKAIIDLLPQAVPSYEKILPGLDQFNSWKNETMHYEEKIKKGELAPEDVAKELTNKANEKIKAAREEIIANNK